MNTFVLDTIYKIRNYRMCRVEHWQGLLLVLRKVAERIVDPAK